MITIRVKLFALLKDLAGRGEVALRLADGATVGGAWSTLLGLHPGLSERPMRVAFAVNREYVGDGHVLNDGDELAAIPPVSGGSTVDDDWIEIRPTPLRVGAAVRFVSDARAGGIDVFLGTTRRETRDGRSLAALEYEAYEEMAVARLRELAAAARLKWPIVKLALLHRVGTVALEEPSVIVAVSTPHRAESFEACRNLIDALKADVPIWKREVWAGGGAGTWVHPA